MTFSTSASFASVSDAAMRRMLPFTSAPSLFARNSASSAKFQGTSCTFTVTGNGDGVCGQTNDARERACLRDSKFQQLLRHYFPPQGFGFTAATRSPGEKHPSAHRTTRQFSHRLSKLKRFTCCKSSQSFGG